MSDTECNMIIDKACVIRFSVFGTLMGFANIISYLYARNANIVHDIETAGWPFICYEVGGTGFFEFYPFALMGDIIVAVILTGFATFIFREGVWKTLLKWKRWGTPFAEQESRQTNN